jgi:hypothetical protein
MKIFKSKSVFRLLVDSVICPWLLLFFLLTAGVVSLAQPPVFKVIYEYSMKGRPALVEDGLKIATGLSGQKSFSKINRTLERGRIGVREIDHYEDIRNKIRISRGFAILSLIAVVLIGVACSTQWKLVVRVALVWFVSVAILSTIWAVIDFRHFFRSLHWWVFQDDSWILPDNCYSLILYPYAVWQAVGATLMMAIFFLLVAGSFLFWPRKK